MAGSKKFLLAATLALTTIVSGAHAQEARDPYLVVLGIAQDGGAPQAGTKEHAGWTDERHRHLVVSLAVVDPVTSRRWMFEATPDFREQLHHMDEIAPHEGIPGLAGIFLTHGHIGHYTGLMFVGHESMGASAVPVYVMPQMGDYLTSNGPWSQLVRYGNITLRPMVDGEAAQIAPNVRVTPFIVPHRQEFTEVVGYRIDGPNRSILFIPDIDSWEEMDDNVSIETMIRDVDVAYLDGSFFDTGEMPGRDMSGFPHPFISHSMERFAALPASERTKIRFIHLNHTNRALDPDSEESRKILEAGYRIARQGERIGL